MVRVALRVQPSFQTGIGSCVEITKDEEQICFDNETYFAFDSIYSSSRTQEQVFNKSILPLLNQFFEGEDVAVLAFGSHSSSGIGVCQDMVPRLIEQIIKSNNEYQMNFKFIEYYNKTFFNHDVQDETVLLNLLNLASQNRKYHTVTTIQLSLNQKPLSQFHFIELEGYPESVEDSVLNEFVTTITTGQKSSTRGEIMAASLDILIDSKHVLVFTHISPDASDYTPTLHTLTYAHRIQQIAASKDSDIQSRISQLQTQTKSLLQQQPDQMIQSIRLQINQLKEEAVKDPLKLSFLRDIEDLESELLENHGQLSLYYHQMTVPSSKSSGKKVTASLSSNRRHSSKKRPVMYRMKSSTSSNHKRKTSNNQHQQMLDLLELLNDEVYIGDNTFNQSSKLPFEETSIHPTQELIAPTDPIKSTTEEDELEALAVPSWTDIPKAQSSQGSVKRQSISVDSMWDDTDSSVTTSHPPVRTKSKPTQSKEAKRSSRNLIRMLHQVQADLLVKRELVGQLEKTEGQYTQMRTNYEQRLNEYKTYISEVQDQRDEAQKVVEVATAAAAAATATPSIKRAASVLELRENRQAQEVRSQYEVKMKRLITENSELKKKNTQATQQLQTARLKSDTTIQRLKQDIEALKSDKKQLVRQLKQESDRSRESTTEHQKEIQQLKRKLMVTMDAKKKVEEAHTTQAQVLKKKTDDVVAIHAQLKQLTLALRKAATEGCIMNEATLDRILKASNNRK